MKKTWKILIGSTIAGGAAAAIAVPTSIAVQQKTDILEKMNEELTNLSQKIGSVKKSENKIASDVVFDSTIKYMYAKEQEGSLKMQVMDFKYEVYKLKKEWNELDEEKKNNSPAPTSSRVTDIDERIKEIKKEIKNINVKIVKVQEKSFDYNASDFSSDYPTILKPIDKLKEKQLSMLRDEKKAFIEDYSTKGDGEGAWITELSKKYKGATSNEGAVDNQIVQLIKTDAMKKFARKFNNDYTVEQALAKYDKNETSSDLTKGAIIYTFANAGLVQMSTTGTKPIIKLDATNAETGYKYDGTKKKGNVKLEDKIIFLSTDSANPDDIYIKIDAQDKIIEQVAKKGLVHLKHALFGFKQNPKGHTLDWTVSKDTIKKIFGFYGSGSKKGTSTQMFVEFLAQQSASFNLFKDTNDKEKGETKRFIALASDNSGTINNSGDLGVKNSLKMIKDMKPGFGIGLLQAIMDQHNTSLTQSGKTALTNLGTNPSTSFDPIIQKLLDMKKFITDTNTSGGLGINNNVELSQYLESKTDDEINKIFGSKLKDVFYASKSNFGYNYKINDNTYMVFSDFGMHIIKVELDTTATLVKKFQEDIKEAIDEEKGLTDINSKYSDTFSEAFANNKIINILLNDTKLKADYKKFIFDDSLKEKLGESDQAKAIAILEENIKLEIQSFVNKKARNIMNDTFIKYIKDQNKKELRKDSKITSVKYIYDQINWLAQKEEGA